MSTELNYFTDLREYQKLFRFKVEKRNVIIHGPHFSLQSKILQSVLGENNRDYQVIQFDSQFVNGGYLDYDSVLKHLTYKSGIPFEDLGVFDINLKNIISKIESNTILVFNFHNALSEIYYDFLLILNSYLAEVDTNNESLVTFIVQSDYKLYFYLKWKEDYGSNLSFTDFHFYPLHKDELPKILNLQGKKLHFTYDEIHDICQGHYGILNELLVNLHDDFVLTSFLTHSNVLDSIISFLTKKPMKYLSLLESYSKKRMQAKYEDPFFIDLMNIGLIQKIEVRYYKTVSGALYSFIIDSLKELYSQTDQYKVSSKIDTIENVLNDDTILLLHISDVHLGDKFAYKLPSTNDPKASIIDLLKLDLDSFLPINKSIDSILISGDLVEFGTFDEYSLAKHFISELSESVQVDIENIHFIPGNHDINWEPRKYEKKNPLNNTSKDPYNNLREIFNKKLITDSCELVEIFSPSGNNSIRLVLFDSTIIEGPESGGIGYVSEEAILNAKKLLIESNNQYLKSSQDIPRTALAIHHHVFPSHSPGINNALQKKISVLANSSQLLEFALKNNIDFITHGHEHQPFININYQSVFENQFTLKGIKVFAAGSFSIKPEYLGTIAKNHYYLLAINKESVEVISRTLTPGSSSFEAHFEYSFKDNENWH